MEPIASKTQNATNDAINVEEKKNSNDTESVINIDPSSYPSEIISNELYLGDKIQAQNEKMLLKLGITHIVNVTLSPNWFEKQFKYLQIQVYDSATEPLIVHFEDAISFIGNALNVTDINNTADATNDTTTTIANDDTDGKNDIKSHHEEKKDSDNNNNNNNDSKKGDKNKVFVHCAQGVSRSSTIVIAYLMKRYQWNLIKSMQFVANKRDCILPNPGFMQQLKLFEANKCVVNDELLKKNNFSGKGKDNNKDNKDKAQERKFNEKFFQTIKKYKCEDCDAVLINSFQMQQHMEQTNFEHCMFDEI